MGGFSSVDGVDGDGGGALGVRGGLAGGGDRVVAGGVVGVGGGAAVGDLGRVGVVAEGDVGGPVAVVVDGRGDLQRGGTGGGVHGQGRVLGGRGGDGDGRGALSLCVALAGGGDRVVARLLIGVGGGAADGDLGRVGVVAPCQISGPVAVVVDGHLHLEGSFALGGVHGQGRVLGLCDRH